MTNNTSALFQPITFRGLEMQNRIMVSPMCQYSSSEGCVSDWHRMHLGQFLIGGAGLLIMEMTNVQPNGRISPHCVGLYSDATEVALTNLIEFLKGIGPVPIGVQLAHAGRKASTAPPWKDRHAVLPSEGGWVPVAPSAIAYSNESQTPRELARTEIQSLIESFVESAKRASRIGFSAIELHAAHGYLLHQFLSPLTNQRSDEYGGSLHNRMRFVLEVFAAVRGVWDQHKPIGVRVSATDWAPGGWTVAETVVLSKQLRALGCDWIDVSSGGLVEHQRIKTGPGYQVELAREIRDKVGIPTIAVGQITEPQQAEEIISSGSADVVALARGMLYNPRWAWHAADELGAVTYCPDQYLRCKAVVRRHN